MDDLISRAAAVECAIDAVDDWDGGWNPNRETVIRKYFAQVPAVDAIPVEWIKAQIKPYTGDVSDIGKSARNGTIKDLIRKWQKEQEENDD